MASYRNTRELHRMVTLGSVAVLLISVITGLLWAYAPYLYWEGGYMKRKHALPAPDLMQTRFSIPDVILKTKAKFGEEVLLQELHLRSDAGMLLFYVHYRGAEGEVQRALLDARSGDWISPLTEEVAVRFARQYVAGNPPVAAASFLKEWVHRKKKNGRPAWQVRFGDAGETDIFIDPDTGAILEDQDAVRRFHFFIMKLHQFNFFGFKKVLTIIPGLPLLIAIVTGMMMWATPKWRKYVKNKANKKKERSGLHRAGKVSVR